MKKEERIIKILLEGKNPIIEAPELFEKEKTPHSSEVEGGERP